MPPEMLALIPHETAAPVAPAKASQRPPAREQDTTAPIPVLTVESKTLANTVAANAKRANDASHRKHREMKQQVIEHYVKNRSTYPSKNEAAKKMAGKLVALTYATVRRYLEGL